MASDAQGQRENADAICPNVFNRGGSGLDSAVAGGQESFEGVERLLKVNPYVSLAKKGDDWGQQKFKFCGRPPAVQPDHAQALRAFRGFIEPFRQILNPLLVNLVGKRKDEACAYSSLTLYWTVILGFFQLLTEDGGAYSGCFATSFEVTEETRALNIAAWGRRRWNIETGFRVEKHGGFGLEHTFCSDDTAGRNYHLLMQIAYTLWQVFDTGVLSRLSDRCRKTSQEMWAKLLFIAVLVLGLSSVPHVTAGAMRMRRYHLVA